MAMPAFSDFDLDLREGQVAEGFVEMCLRTLEVKRDREWMRTGNLYIEETSRNSGVWSPSGIARTRAGHWAFVIGPSECPAAVIMPTTIIGEARKSARPVECGMEPNPTRGRLVKLSSMFRLLRGISTADSTEANDSPQPGLLGFL